MNSKTTIVGFDLSENTVKLRFPRENSIIGMTTGQVIDVVYENCTESEPRSFLNCYCGTPIGAGYKFCSECGRAIWRS